eukprot:SAG11_NODE_6397_length_1321_cov_4.606383_2_plen_150_part_00
MLAVHVATIVTGNFSSPRPADTVYCPKSDIRQIHITPGLPIHDTEKIYLLPSHPRHIWDTFISPAANYSFDTYVPVNQTQNRPDLTDFGICLYPASCVCTPSCVHLVCTLVETLDPERTQRTGSTPSSLEFVCSMLHPSEQSLLVVGPP